VCSGYLAGEGAESRHGWGMSTHERPCLGARLSTSFLLAAYLSQRDEATFLHPSSSSPGSRGRAPSAPKCALIPARKLIRI
jgi:hypothetical protein